MPRRISKRVAAETDLIEIWRYTYSEWGERQADRYHAQLADAFELLRENPMLGAALSDGEQAYRSLRVNRHRIFYRLAGDDIEVVRVLHIRQDFDHLLGGD